MEVYNQSKYSFTFKPTATYDTIDIHDQNVAKADEIFNAFISEYGAFFVEEVKMGAKLIVEMNFNSQSDSTEEMTDRLNCFVSTVSGGSGSSFTVNDVDVTYSG